MDSRGESGGSRRSEVNQGLKTTTSLQTDTENEPSTANYR